MLNRSSVALAITLPAGAFLATSAQAMTIDMSIARTQSFEQVGFVCTPQCLEHKMTAYGPVCSKRGQECHLTGGQPNRIMPPPARSHR